MFKPNSVVERERDENAVQCLLNCLILSYGFDLAMEQYFEHMRRKTVIQKE